MPKPFIEDLDAMSLGWTPIEGEPGLREKILSVDPLTGEHTRLLQIDPGYSSDKVLEHDFWEEVYIVSGEVYDHTMGKTIPTGTYSNLPPGTKHGPYSSDTGCMTIEIRYFTRDMPADCKIEVLRQGLYS